MTPASPTRRRVLAAAGGLGFGVSFLARAAFAASEGDLARRKLVVVICRGGMDGLSVSPPIADAAYAGLRGAIAINPDQALALGDGFALHPALAQVHAMALKGEARIAPAVATPDRARSHFEAQDVLETGAAGVYATSSGWLNRTVAALSRQRRVDALSVGPTTPLILRGPVEVGSWSPGGAIDGQSRLPGLLQDLYKDDPVLGPALAQGLAVEAMAKTAISHMDRSTAASTASPPAPADGATAAQAAPARGRDAAGKLGADVAAFMGEPQGPRIVAISLDGFDTHANQGAAEGQLATRLAYLDAMLGGLHGGLADGWPDTRVLVATEFGRTAHVNGTGGTDHGTASTALVLGGGLGHGLIGDWPGLADLYESRDLRPTLDMRSLFKGVLVEHLGMDRAVVERDVFPQSAAAPAVVRI